MFIHRHTLGGHYTFERVPFDLVVDLFGFDRKHDDRLAYFSRVLCLFDCRVADAQTSGAHPLDHGAVFLCTPRGAGGP